MNCRWALEWMIYVRTMGNRGAHIEQDSTKRITPQQALYTLIDLHYVLGYNSVTLGTFAENECTFLHFTS